VQDRGRVERRDHLAAVPRVDGAAHPRDALLGLQHVLRGEVAERDDHRRLDQRDLLDEPGRTGLDLVLLRIAVAGRAALQHVRDVDLLAGQTDLAEHPGEQLSRGADERLALLILVHPRRLADEQQVGVRIAHTEHHLGAAVREAALRAGRRLEGDLGERSGHDEAPVYVRGTRSPIRVTIS
jgi:hypothetical protein